MEFIRTLNLNENQFYNEITTPNIEVGIMTASRICPDQYNITPRHIQMTIKAQL